jgi:hypothetical protein
VIWLFGQALTVLRAAARRAWRRLAARRA